MTKEECESWSDPIAPGPSCWQFGHYLPSASHFSLFVNDLVESDNRQQDPNIYSDTKARYLVYSCWQFGHYLPSAFHFSLFVNDLVESDNSQDPNIYCDTKARYLVYSCWQFDRPISYL